MHIFFAIAFVFRKLWILICITQCLSTAVLLLIICWTFDFVIDCDTRTHSILAYHVIYTEERRSIIVLQEKIKTLSRLFMIYSYVLNSHFIGLYQFCSRFRNQYKAYTFYFGYITYLKGKQRSCFVLNNIEGRKPCSHCNCNWVCGALLEMILIFLFWGEMAN